MTSINPMGTSSRQDSVTSILEIEYSSQHKHEDLQHQQHQQHYSPPPPQEGLEKEKMHHPTNNTSHVCPNCGAGLGLDQSVKSNELLEYKRRIAELEAQVKILSDKATAAADKLADYEDEIAKLKRPSLPTITTSTTQTKNLLATPPSTVTASLSPTGRLSNFLSITTRRGAGPPSPPMDPSESRPSSASGTPNPLPIAELEKALTTEKGLRIQAESRLQDVTNELEELSATLFQQANEMVADERRARSKLEARIEMLEKRDKEKVVRLGRLEGAVERIGRVKDLLVDGDLTPTSPMSRLGSPHSRAVSPT